MGFDIVNGWFWFFFADCGGHSNINREVLCAVMQISFFAKNSIDLVHWFVSIRARRRFVVILVQKRLIYYKKLGKFISFAEKRVVKRRFYYTFLVTADPVNRCVSAKRYKKCPNVVLTTANPSSIMLLIKYFKQRRLSAEFTLPGKRFFCC